MVRQNVRRLLRALGYDVVRSDPSSYLVALRRQLLTMKEIDVVLDVGANAGQFGAVLRRDLGFGGRICSFEPLASAFRLLEELAVQDGEWQVFHVALGDKPGCTTINVSDNSLSSSLLDMLPTHLDAAPESMYVGTEEVNVTVLDAVFDDVCAPGERVFLKIDTQGYEGRVLSGARRSLPKIDLVQLEMPLLPLYAGELSFADLCEHMFAQGFRLVALDPAFSDPRTGQLLQVDGIFDRP